MSPKQVLIAHGEKIAVAAVLLLCVLKINGAYDDPSIRPQIKDEKGALVLLEPQVINDKVKLVNQVFTEGQPPQLKPPPDYLGDMRSRFAAGLPPTQYVSWLSAPPDIGPTARGSVLVYEVQAPSLQGRDVIGSVELTLALPAREGFRPQVRVAGDERKVWQGVANQPANAAEWVGALVELRPLGGKDWRPAAGKGIDSGLVPLALARTPLRIDNVDPWMTYEFRAQLVVKATGLREENPDPAKSPTAVVVWPGRFVEPGAPVDQALRKLEEDLRQRKPEVLARLKPFDRKPPSGVTLAASERLYLGAEAPPPYPKVAITDSKRVVFERVQGAPPNVSATFLVTRQITLANGSAQWIPTPPQRFATPQGTEIGLGKGPEGNTIVSHEGQRIPLDLRTGFEFVDVKRDVERVFYYAITDRPSQANPKERELVVDPVKKSTEIAVLRNRHTGQVTEIPKLTIINPPTRPGVVTDPHTPAVDNEINRFIKDPAGFTPPRLVPLAPVRWEPGEGPLKKLWEQQAELQRPHYTTSTPYYELSDGRLVWWERYNKKIMVHAPQGATEGGGTPPTPEPGPEPAPEP